MASKARASRVTLNDVALRADVSPVTVSRVLRAPEKVSEPLRTRVHAAVHELAYIPNQLASALASSRTGRVAVIVPSFTNGVFDDYLRAAHDMFVPAGSGSRPEFQLRAGPRRKGDRDRARPVSRRRSSSPASTRRRRRASRCCRRASRSFRPWRFRRIRSTSTSASRISTRATRPRVICSNSATETSGISPPRSTPGLTSA